MPKINQDYLLICEENQKRLKDFLKLCENDINYIKDISQCLRNLYCEKSGTKSFLYRLFGKYNFKIYVNTTISMHEKVKRGLLPESILNGFIFGFTNTPTLWFDKSGQRKTECIYLLDAIELEGEIYIDNQHFSIKKGIEIIADKFGAHIDEKISVNDSKIFVGGILIGGKGVIENLIINLAKATINVLEESISFINTGKENEFIKNNPINIK